jgi:putative N-acetylmannosamine-6-phosphate epimerase/predicted NBD/HSP70 family sugar kinase
LTRDELLVALSHCPLVASVQASQNSPLEDPAVLLKMAEASAQQGVRVLRLQGVPAISLIRSTLGLPVIGLIKHHHADSEVYVTPTRLEVRQLIETGCEVIALDGTFRPRPGGEVFGDLVSMIHDAGRLAMADCDTVESAEEAVAAGADIVGTTLAGYTDARKAAIGPDIDLVRQIARVIDVPILAEGRYQEPWQSQAALCAGATAVVIGGALNDPVKQTRRFVSSVIRCNDQVGAFDIGGTWIRFGLFSPDWKLLHSERDLLPNSRRARYEWMLERVNRHKSKRIGISTGGTVDPKTNCVIESKPIIPDHVGSDFNGLADEVFALNDGLATAWGHACLPQFAGKRVGTLALGTGVGCGMVDQGRIFMGPNGEYPRLNDLTPNGSTIEEMLGGASLTKSPTVEQQQTAIQLFATAWDTIRAMWMPEHVVLCGGIGLAPWLHAGLLAQTDAGMSLSPFKEDAGLYGAAALALFHRCP